MRFPSLIEFIKDMNVFLLSGPLLLAGSAFCWYRLAVSRWRGVPLAKPRAYVISGLALLLIGGVHFWGIYSCLANALDWRTVRPEMVSAIQVIRVSRHPSCPAEEGGMTIADPKLIAEAFAALGTARSWRRSPETPLEGYRLRLKLTGSESYSDYYLSAYRRSSPGNLVTVVIPHIGPDPSGTLHHAGYYSCPQFSEWLGQHVDPDFDGRR